MSDAIQKYFQLIQGLKTEIGEQTAKSQIIQRSSLAAKAVLAGPTGCFGMLSVWGKKGISNLHSLFPEETGNDWATLKGTDETSQKITKIVPPNSRLEVEERNLHI